MDQLESIRRVEAERYLAENLVSEIFRQGNWWMSIGETSDDGLAKWQKEITSELELPADSDWPEIEKAWDKLMKEKRGEFELMLIRLREYREKETREGQN